MFFETRIQIRRPLRGAFQLLFQRLVEVDRRIGVELGPYCGQIIGVVAPLRRFGPRSLFLPLVALFLQRRNLFL